MKHYVSSALFAAAFFLIGVSVGINYQKNSTPLLIQEVNIPEKESASIINIHQVSPLGIEGSVKSGNVRIFSGNDVLEVNSDSNFQINTSAQFKNISAVVPENAQFFASSKGSKYYSVSDTKKLEDISPANLVFFTSQAEAKEKGYSE